MIFLGFKEIDFTDEKTRMHIVGLQLFVGIPITNNGEGYACQKYFVQKDKLDYEGDLSDYINMPITLTFDYRRKVIGANFAIV